LPPCPRLLRHWFYQQELWSITWRWVWPHEVARYYLIPSIWFDVYVAFVRPSVSQWFPDDNLRTYVMTISNAYMRGIKWWSI
jgi:hypothetical protein